MGVWDMMPQALVAHFDPGPAPAPPTVQLAQPGHLVIQALDTVGKRLVDLPSIVS